MDPLTKLENQMQHEMYKQIRLYYSATAIALNVYWGWQQNRISKLLKETQKAWNGCGKDNSKSMVELLEEETGVELQNGSGKSWREYAFLNSSHPLNFRKLKPKIGVFGSKNSQNLIKNGQKKPFFNCPKKIILADL